MDRMDTLRNIGESIQDMVQIQEPIVLENMIGLAPFADRKSVV